MTHVELVREKLLDLLRGGDAHMDYDEVLADFPEDRINDKGPNMPYSAWHILEHMRIAQWDILEFIRNPEHVSPPYPEGFRPAPDQTADLAQWRQSVEQYGRDRRALQDLVADPDTDPLAPIPHVPEYTIFREILVVSDHNAYHLGELALLRQVLDAWPATRPYLTG
jgi:hypothetical protein